jgi:acyl-CoA hydrolase
VVVGRGRHGTVVTHDAPGSADTARWQSLSAAAEQGGSTQLDLTALLHPGDLVVWGQASAEPRTLTELLVAQRHGLGGVRCFVGMPAGTALAPGQTDGLALLSYCGTGVNARLHAAGALEIVPARYSALPDLLSAGALAADVVFVQVSAPDEQGRHSLGLADDYLSAVLDTARVIVAEVNDQVPWTFGARTLTEADWTACVRSSRPPAEMPATEPPSDVLGVAEQVARLVDDGATVQYGIGALPEAVLGALSQHRDLGIHSGLLTDAAMKLMECGAVTGVRKTVDPGVAVAGFVAGSRRLFRFVDRNHAVALRGTRYTHDQEILAAQHHLVAINAALEVDLSGQVNAEQIGQRYVGAVGGAGDFLRGAARSRGGLPVVALPSTARGASRIVARLSGPVSTPRSDAAVIVTEFGAADLRGATLTQRAERLLAIAHPSHRAALEADLATQERDLAAQRRPPVSRPLE